MKLLLSFSLLSLTLLPLSLSCPLLNQAFHTVTNFPNISAPCSSITTLHLPSSNLSGAVSWSLLANISSLRSLDLSHNSLRGSIPSSFAHSLLHLNVAHNRLGGPLRFAHNPTLLSLNLSRNHFTSATNISSLSNLKSLDLSHNTITLVPPGLSRLRNLDYLDVSSNNMSGVFPDDFNVDQGSLRSLNVSYNNLTGVLNSSALQKYGSSAFTKAGSLAYEQSSSSDHKKVQGLSIVVVVIVSVSILVIMLVIGAVVAVIVMRRRRRKGWEEEVKGVKEAEEVPQWVAEARWGAKVVIFEKPLMEMTFAELAVATSGFGREAQMAAEGGRSGAMYRAVLGEEMEVVVRVVQREKEEVEEEKVVRELGMLRHPNLLPLIGYCISGIISL